MNKILLKNIDLLATMDNSFSVLEDCSLVAEDGIIRNIAAEGIDLEEGEEYETIDMSGYLVMPGMINCHHHMYQSLTRVVPKAQNVGLFQWLKVLYPIWGKLTPEAIYVSSVIAMSELLLSGCTSSSDHLYMYPNGVSLDDSIRAANDIGIRFHPTRGSMSLGESGGGLPPDHLVEKEGEILADCQRVIEEYHDDSYGSMLRIGLAPCSPFSVSEELMKATANMAKEYNVRLHTHLAETIDEEEYCLAKFGYRPLEYIMELGWDVDTVWLAHMVHCDKCDVSRLADARMSITHCPSSNMRLASGIAPIRNMLGAGVNVSIGVDGSASNDGGHMIGEARQAMLLARLNDVINFDSGGYKKAPEEAFPAIKALEMATKGGAASLGRADIGKLEIGMCADLIAIRMDKLEYAGGLHDPLAAVLMCSSVKPDIVIVNGQIVVENGMIINIDLPPIIEKHNLLSYAIVNE
tara:strand:- start:3054 stop:4448 length:1395 start_codon:yes stop_codon:yes gene_type:complete